MNKEIIKEKNYLNDSKDSKTVLVLMVSYMSSVLLFSHIAALNIISQVLFVLAFGGSGIYLFIHGKNFRYDSFLKYFALFIAFCFVTFFWSENKSNTISKIITLIQLFALSVVMYSYISAYDNIDVFIRGLLLAGIICCIVVIGYYGIGEYVELMMSGARLGGNIANVNTIGLYSATTVMLCFYYGYLKNNKKAYILMILPIMTAFGSGSRKALVMVVLSIVLIIFMKYRESISLRSFIKFLLATVIACLLIWWASTLPIFSGVFERFSQMLGGETGIRDNSTNVRDSMTRIGFQYFLKNPYKGIGLGNSYIILGEVMNRETYFHNNFVEILASCGIFGFLIYYAMYFYLIKNLYLLAVRTGDSRAMLMFVLILTQLVLSYGFVSYYDKMTYIYLSMAAATLSIVKRKIYEGAYDTDEEATESAPEEKSK